MKYTTLGFTLFRKCNAQCKVCCFESSPVCKESLDSEKIKKYIDSAVGDPDLRTIAFTGGEVFLEYELLLDLVKYATEKGFNTTTITNCFWASSENIALRKIYELKKAGLKKISVSYDEFHAAFIDASNIRNVLNACKRLGVPITVGVMKKNDSDIGKIINNLGDASLNCGVLMYPVLPVGGAAKTLSSTDFIKCPVETLTLNCQYEGNVVVRYDGKIQPCCNQCVVETELVVGDYAEDTYGTTIAKLKNNSLLYLLRTEGLFPFLKYAKEELHMDVPKDVVSPCELCALFFSKENLDKFYPFVKKQMTKRGFHQNHAVEG